VLWKPPVLDLIVATVDIAWLRSLPGGRELSNEMLLILALVVYEDYRLFEGGAGPGRGGPPG
jgi:hypothetical protein